MSRLSESIADLRANPRQWDAFQAQGHCVVLAAPGSGKTKLLTTRVASDLLAKIPRPHGAACITLTNPAADELRRRIEDLGVEQRSTLFIGTVHSFALRRVILPFARLAGRPELAAVNIASAQQQNAAFDEAINAVFPHGEDKRFVRSTIEINRRRLADAADWARAGDQIQEAARRYEESLRLQGLIDFDDLVAIAVRFVEQHQVIRRVLTARYPYFYVDEYQDLAPGLDRLVRALCLDYVVNAELFAVGDPDQAVFGFTGTRPELLTELAEHSDVTVVRLDHNYRCGAEIIRVANRMRPGQHEVRGDREGGHVSAVRCPTGFAGQCRAAATAAQQARDRGISLDEIVAICPTNDQCQQLADVLRQSGLPASVRGSEYRLTQVTSFVEGCASWAVLERELSNYRLGALLRQWRSILGPQWERQTDAALTTWLLSYADKGEEPARLFVDALLDLGLKRALAHSGLADDAVQMTRMQRTLSTGNLKGLTLLGLAERARKADRVEVTTMTSSKGLEFDVVLILGMDERRIPDYRSFDDPEMLQEDRRKFYVSVTRARDEVRIFYSGFVEWPNGRPSYAGPSRFLQEIGLVEP